jgi:hypothetical protein
MPSLDEAIVLEMNTADESNVKEKRKNRTTAR